MTKNKGGWTVKSSQITHKNKWFKVRSDQVVKADGSPSEYHTVITHPAVFIIAQDTDREIYLIRQYRYTVDRLSIEIPAGSTDGEDPLKAAKRELQEETGLTAEKWEKMGEFYSANGLLQEKAYVYLATGLAQTGDNEMAEEGIDLLLKLPLEKIIEMIKDGKIHDGQTISSIMLYLAKNNPTIQ